MANSIPKGGTHLIVRLLNLLGYKEAPLWIGADLVRGRGEFFKKIIRGANSNNTILIGSEVPVKIGRNWLSRKFDELLDNSVFGAHCLYTEELDKLLLSKNVKVVSIVRDPRSIAMSHLHYIKKSKNHFFYNEYMSLPTDVDRLKITILGGDLGQYSLISLKKRYQDYIRWSESNNAIIVKFEDLVGAKGGGSDQNQLKAIEQVANFISVELDDNKRNYVQKNLFGKSSTFRQGKTKGWESELNAEILKLLSYEITEELIKLGYETEDSWVDRYLRNEY